MNANAVHISTQEMLEIQIRKWTQRRGVRNIVLNPSHSHPHVPPGEIVIAEIVDRSGVGIFMTSNGFTAFDRGFVPYNEIARINWPSAQFKRTPNLMTKESIELQLRDGTTIMLDGLDQAVFPLLHFFKWTLKQREKSAQSTAQ